MPRGYMVLCNDAHVLYYVIYPQHGLNISVQCHCLSFQKATIIISCLKSLKLRGKC